MVVLDEVCRQLPSGGDHKTRRFIAERLTEAAEHGETRLGELEAAARHALRNAGIGFVRPTSNAAEANPRSSRGSPARSCATIPSIRDASTSVGLSAGAAAAAVMGSAYGDLYAAIGIHSGLACRAATDLPSALMAMRQGGGPEAIPRGGSFIPTIVFHGDRATTVHPNNGGRIVRQSIGATSTKAKVHRGRVPGGHAYTRTLHTDADGRALLEHWEIHGAGHAWSGGSPAGSYTDPDGPDATREMLRLFLEHSFR